MCIVKDGDHNKLPVEFIASSNEGVRYLRAQDLKEGEILSDNPIFIKREYFESISRSHIKAGYFLFSIMASIGNIAVVPDNFPDCTGNRAVGILIPKDQERSIVENLHTRMKERRELRNDFFHSAKLLRLSIDRNDCIEAFCDLLDYGELLFQANWRNTLSAGRTLGTLEILLRLELKSYGNPSLISKVNEILENCPQYLLFDKKSISTSKKGIQISKYPADLHLILSVIGGGQELRDKLSVLLH